MTSLRTTATILLVVGLVRRIMLYWKTPAPLKIPTTPAPVTRTNTGRSRIVAMSGLPV